MKNLSQTQFFVAALVLVIVIALVAVLADGLKKYDTEAYQSEQNTNENMAQIPPSTPDTIAEELRMEEATAAADLQTEVETELAAAEQENEDIITITESYE